MHFQFLDVEMLQIQSDITSLTKQLHECQKERGERENAAQSEVNSLQQSLDKVNDIGRDIQRCVVGPIFRAVLIKLSF